MAPATAAVGRTASELPNCSGELFERGGPCTWSWLAPTPGAASGLGDTSDNWASGRSLGS